MSCESCSSGLWNLCRCAARSQNAPGTISLKWRYPEPTFLFAGVPEESRQLWESFVAGALTEMNKKNTVELVIVLRGSFK